MKISEWFAKHGRDMGSKVVTGIVKPTPPKIDLDKIKDKLHTLPTIGIPKLDADKQQPSTGWKKPPPGIKPMSPEQRKAFKEGLQKWKKSFK